MRSARRSPAMGAKMDARKTAHDRLLAACARAWGGPLAPLADFLGGPLPHADAFRDIAPVRLSVIDHLGDSRNWTTPAFSELVESVISGAEHYHWRTSYSTADRGIDQDFVARYGYFNLVSPDGPYLCRDYRLTVAFWGAGLKYPEHTHDPEELYAVIAGDVEFRAAGRSPMRVRPGGVVHHAPRQAHATDMIPGPMLAVVGWKGENLMRFAKIRQGEAT